MCGADGQASLVDVEGSRSPLDSGIECGLGEKRSALASASCRRQRRLFQALRRDYLIGVGSRNRRAKVSRWGRDEVRRAS